MELWTKNTARLPYHGVEINPADCCYPFPYKVQYKCAHHLRVLCMAAFQMPKTVGLVHFNASFYLACTLPVSVCDTEDSKDSRIHFLNEKPQPQRSKQPDCLRSVLSFLVNLRPVRYIQLFDIFSCSTHSSKHIQSTHKETKKKKILALHLTRPSRERRLHG